MQKRKKNSTVLVNVNHIEKGKKWYDFNINVTVKFKVISLNGKGKLSKFF